MEWFKQFPDSETLIGKWRHDGEVPEVNGHLHSPYSFCAFSSINQMFEMAGDEKVKVLGINDFYTVDGYDEFARLSGKFRIFPLFNIEFMGLMKELQEKDIRVNDPNNPGRVYFSGKALRYPLELSGRHQGFLDDLMVKSQDQVREMIRKADAHLRSAGAPFGLDYEGVKEKYAENLVRERHIAKAIREGIAESFPREQARDGFYLRLFDGKPLSAAPDDEAAVENEIRSVLLKKGGKAFVPEDTAAFPEIGRIIDFILNAEGVPCYPVLLDDRHGKMTGFESDWDRMDEVLGSLNVSCLELIPARNSLAKLKEFVDFFHRKEYIITFGTEHNSPGLFPIAVSVEKNRALTPELKKVSWEGCCALAAHQYLVARGKTGLVNDRGITGRSGRKFHIDLGNAVIKEFTSQA